MVVPAAAGVVPGSFLLLFLILLAVLSSLSQMKSGASRKIDGCVGKAWKCGEDEDDTWQPGAVWGETSEPTNKALV